MSNILLDVVILNYAFRVLGKCEVVVFGVTQIVNSYKPNVVGACSSVVTK